MPLNQTDHGDMSWEVLSRGWPETNEHAYAKWVFANKTNVIPYGSYVLVNETLRVEQPDMLQKLNERFTIVRKAILGEKI